MTLTADIEWAAEFERHLTGKTDKEWTADIESGRGDRHGMDS